MKFNFSEKVFTDLWMDPKMSNEDIQKKLGISNYALYVARNKLNLPPRKIGRHKN